MQYYFGHIMKGRFCETKFCSIFQFQFSGPNEALFLTCFWTTRSRMLWMSLQPLRATSITFSRWSRWNLWDISNKTISPDLGRAATVSSGPPVEFSSELTSTWKKHFDLIQFNVKSWLSLATKSKVLYVNFA